MSERMSVDLRVLEKGRQPEVTKVLTSMGSGDPENEILFVLIVDPNGKTISDGASKIPDTDYPGDRLVTELTGQSVDKFLNEVFSTRNKMLNMGLGRHSGDLDFIMLSFEKWILSFRFSHNRDQTKWTSCLIILSSAERFRYDALIDDTKRLINGLNDCVKASK